MPDKTVVTSDMERDLIIMAQDAVNHVGMESVEMLLANPDKVVCLDSGGIDHPFLGLCWTYIYPCTDESDEWRYYVSIGFTFYQPNIFAEIEDGTYGQLQWFRVYF